MQKRHSKVEKIINTSIEEFKQKMHLICKKEYETELDFHSAMGIARKIRDVGRELSCGILEGYFESWDVEVPAIFLDGEKYLYKGKSPKQIVTCLGKITINRSYYQHRSGGKSIFPLDEKLGVNDEILMPDVKELVLFSCAYNTPEESSRLLEKCGFIKLHATQIKKAVTSTSEYLETSGSDIMDNVRKNETESGADILACSLDGVNVLLNQPGKKKGRPLERPTDKGTNTTSSSYKNAMCGSISHYNIEEKDGKKIPDRISSKYIARMPEERYPTFKRDFEKELKAAAPGPEVAKLVITDAHKSIWGYLKDNPAFKDYQWIIDFFHAAEHLSHLAEAIFGKNSDKAKKWYNKYRNIMKDDQQGINKLIRSGQNYLSRKKYNKSTIENIKKHLGYFKKHKKFMQYATFLEKGWPIGSGVIEAACKSVVKQRMCRSGQRWSIKGGQAILNLRAIAKSGRWDGFWEHFSDEYYTKNAA